jgi:Putative transposase of IS4/5 family (DUF4096)
MDKVKLSGCLKSIGPLYRLISLFRNWRVPDNHYDTDLNDAAWKLLAPLLPAARTGGRPRTTDIRSVINAIFYLLRTGCQ